MIGIVQVGVQPGLATDAEFGYPFLINTATDFAFKGMYNRIDINEKQAPLMKVNDSHMLQATSSQQACSQTYWAAYLSSKLCP